MKRSEVKRTGSIWTYILCFSALLLLAILLLGGYLYQFYYRTIYEDFCAANGNYLHAVESQYENDMGILNDVTTQLSLSETLTHFRLEEDPLRSLPLKKELFQYAVVSNFYSSIFFYNHADTYLFNAYTSSSLERFLNTGLVFADLPPEALARCMTGETAKMEVIPEQPVSGYLAMHDGDISERAAGICVPLDGRNSGTLLFLVGGNYFDRLLADDAGEARMTCLLYNNTVIASRDALGLPADARAALLKAARAPGEGGARERLAGANYLVTKSTGGSGFTYCTFQPLRVFQGKVAHGQWGIFMMLILCTVPSALLITLFSKKLSGRVRFLNGLLSRAEKPSYSLSTIETGIRTLVEQDQLTKKESRPLQRTRFIQSFVREDYPDRAAAVAAAKKTGLAVDKQFYIVLLLDDYGNSNKTADGRSALLAELERSPTVTGYGLSIVVKNQLLFVLFSDSAEQLDAFSESLHRLAQTYFHKLVMAGSATHTDFNESAQAYFEATSAFDSRFLVENNRLIRYQDFPCNAAAKPFPVQYLQRLKNAIRTGNEDEAKRAIADICQEFSSGQHSLLEFRLLCNDIIHMLLTEKGSGKGSPSVVYDVFDLSRCVNLEDFSQVLYQSCHVLIANRPEAQGIQLSVTQQAMQYLRTHYAEHDLSIGLLAGKLHVSPSALAVSFKTDAGMSPSDYLTQIRMKAAQELLHSTRITVRDISAAVGYEDDHVFMRRFKQVFGQTPTQYRKDTAAQKKSPPDTP